MWHMYFLLKEMDMLKIFVVTNPMGAVMDITKIMNK